MKQNIGSVDETLRIVVGLALISLIFILDGNARWLSLTGFVLIMSATVKWCPIYSVFGIVKR